MHDAPHEHVGDHDRWLDPAGPGHNARFRPAAQWQTPHRSGEPPPETSSEPDLDLVEAAFIEGFQTTSDPTSFLRLAGVPLSGGTADGKELHLLRVELDATTDVGLLTPQLGGGAFRYDPLPAKLVSRRRRLRFIYADGSAGLALSFAEARSLAGASG